MPQTQTPDASDWYKDAIIYELHVRAFADSSGDGIGDFRGLIGKLDYLHSLGVTAIWLLPFFPSPLRDDGYDIADYTAVHPAYGTLDDVRELLDEAHRRGIRVIIEMVLNHTSDQHPWFQRARTAPPGSDERAFYVWSDTPERYQDARVIFQDYEQSNWTWDSVANAYFWHRFYSHQPDLNYDHPPVREAIFAAVDFWLELGVDGLRLDAVPYLAEAEGTSGENLPATHRFLKELRAHIDARYDDRMLLAEANQWPEDAVAYFGDGDECHMAFHFPLMPRLFMALRTEDRLPLEDILAQTPEIPESAQWALFLRNHDELTLEMVTDEERLSMYQAYAPAEEARVNLGIRRRLAPLLGNSRRRIELMNALLCSLPGTPVLYYGDEIGMGDNIYLGDRDSVRTPMQWSADRNAGFSSASPQRLYLPLIVDYEYHHEAVHVEAQAGNPHSLLAFMKRLLHVRQRTRAFGRGSLRLLHPANHRVLAFVREHGDETLLVVANLSRFSQAVELDLGEWHGRTPIEAFGNIPFWPITDQPYPITIGPHAFYWFVLSPEQTASADAAHQALPVIASSDGWESVITGNARSALERALPDFLARQPWLRGPSESVLNARLLDAVPVPHASRPTWIAPVQIARSDGEPERYLLALAFLPVGAEHEPEVTPIARVRSERDGEALIVDAISEGVIDGALRWLAEDSGTPLRGGEGEIVVERTAVDASLDVTVRERAHPPADAHGSNPVFQSEGIVIKFLRRLQAGINPEWEIGVALSEQGFPNAPRTLGALQYRRPAAPEVTVAVLQAHVPNHGHAWDEIARLLDDLLAEARRHGISLPRADLPTARDLIDPTGPPPAEPLGTLLRPSLDLARLAGRRIAALHRALATLPGHPELGPEPITALDRRSLYQANRGLSARTLREIRRAMPHMTDQTRRATEAVLAREQDLYERFRHVIGVSAPGQRARGHGDLHLGQVLLTGDDIVFVDFEGEPDRFVEERRLKTSPLRDVAGMLHSLRLAAMDAARRHRDDDTTTPASAAVTEALLDAWYRHAGAAFIEGYLAEAEADGLLPAADRDRAAMLDVLVLERAVAGVARAVRHAPEDLAIALARVEELLDLPEPAGGGPAAR